MSDVRMIDPSVQPSGTGCVEREATGSWWFHLRRCAVCGHVGCCDRSLGRHGTAHREQTGHAIERSFEPGEDWFWDYRSGGDAEGSALAAPQHHPESQPTPGPAGRVPADRAARLRAAER